MKSPYVRFALGVLDGKYDENIFTGLIEIMMMKQDQEERGVGMQNFKYPPTWDEICNILRIQSPQAYHTLTEKIPGHSQRNF